MRQGTTAIILHSVRKRIGKLLDAIQAVGKGDLDVQLDARGAEEYTAIYEDFNRMVRELKANREEIRTFTDEFSHEFKTPITSICGLAEILLETGREIETPERMRYLELIASEARRLSELSRNTLLLSKVEACEIVTDKETFDLGEQIKHCAIHLLPKMEEKEIQFSMETQDIQYCGNPELLEHVWLNLLHNAVKFTPERGEIGVSAARDGDWLSVRISDNGPGMDEETVSHIFKKYYQSDEGRCKGGSGTGLSIVHRIVTLCGGRVEVTSSLGQGSVFQVLLPVRNYA